MKKFMAIVMTVAMVISMMTVVSFAAGEPTFRLTSATAKAGDTVTLSMMVENNPGITACALAVTYPAGLTLTGKATNKNLFSGGQVVVGGNEKANPYKVNWSEDFDNFYENGEFYTLTFKVADDAEAGDYEIVVSYDQADVYNADMNDVVFATVNGVITVEADEPVITEPTATTIDVPVAPTADNGVVTVFQVAGNATEFGVEYDGVKYPSLATAADLANYYAFAVELIGADGAITAYAK